MGWSRIPLRAIPNEYNDEARNIDEQILALIQQRRAVAGGKRLFPEGELLQEWAERFEMEVNEVSRYLYSLNAALPIQHNWEEAEQLLGVLPIMKRTLVEDCEYVLTHAMQYKEYSVVTVDIKYLKEAQGQIHLRAALSLEIIGADTYNVQQYGGQGGGAHTQLHFTVSPPLPDELDAIEFSLVPSDIQPIGPSFKEVTLDKQVDFY